MQKPTEKKNEKNIWETGRELFGEVVAIIAFALLSLFFSWITLTKPYGIQIMLCIILFNTLWGQFHAQRAYYAIKEIKQEKK